LFDHIIYQQIDPTQRTCAETFTAPGNVLGSRPVWLEFHSNSVSSCPAGISSHFPAEATNQGELVLLNVNLVDLFQMFCRRLCDNLEQGSFVCSEPSISSFVKGFGVSVGLFVREILGIIFLLQTLKTPKDHALKVTTEFSSKLGAHIGREHAEIVVTVGWGWSGLPYLGRKRAKRAGKEGRKVATDGRFFCGWK
jgi:hypothetical protein